MKINYKIKGEEKMIKELRTNLKELLETIGRQVETMDEAEIKTLVDMLYVHQRLYLLSKKEYK